MPPWPGTTKWWSWADRAGGTLRTAGPGRRALPLVPPLGTAYIAWSDPAGIEAYLARSRPPLKPDDLRRCRRALDEVRRRGYSIALDPSTRRKVGEMMDRAVDLPPRDSELGALLARLAHEEYVLAALEPASTYDVMAITAPVLGPDGQARAMIASPISPTRSAPTRSLLWRLGFEWHGLAQRTCGRTSLSSNRACWTMLPGEHTMKMKCRRRRPRIR